MAYQLQEINRRVRSDVEEFLAECDASYAQRISLAADRILSNLEHSPIVLLSGPSGSGKTTTAMKIAEELRRRFTAMLAQRTLAMNDRIQILSRHGLRARLITFFSQYARRWGRQFTVPFDRASLAAYLGVDRSALSRELSRMQADGLLRLHKNQFTLFFPPGAPGG